MFKKYAQIFSFALLICTQNYAQDDQILYNAALQPKRSPIAAISTILGGVLLIDDNYFVSGLNIEFMIGSPFSKTYFYTKVRLAFTPVVVNAYGFAGHILIGVGGTLFDFRNSDYKGWTLVANGGVQWGGAKKRDKNPALIMHDITLIGGELNFRARYHFHEYVAVQLGIEMGANLGFTPSQFINNDFNYSTSIGLAF